MRNIFLWDNLYKEIVALVLLINSMHMTFTELVLLCKNCGREGRVGRGESQRAGPGGGEPYVGDRDIASTDCEC